MKLAALACLASFALAAGAAAAAGPVEGKDYQKVTPAVPSAEPSKVVVTEFFSYPCPHCFAFAKPFAEWSAKQPADVKTVRSAVSIGHQAWEPATVAFYALSAMKAVPAIDDAFFAAIHRERRKLADPAAVAAWVGTQGIDRAKFEQYYRSFSVQLQVKRADELSRQVKLPSVPSLLIDGRYLIPIHDDGDFRDQLAVADALIERALRERSAARKTGS
jgi:thiol:disulfide interchange protein DsbA